MSVPLPLSPGRSNFGPDLQLSYDSGSGNGPFGIGWSLSLPTITRKTDKGLPQYLDRDDSDVFVLSGAEDLVPVLVETMTGWERQNCRRVNDRAGSKSRDRSEHGRDGGVGFSDGARL